MVDLIPSFIPGILVFQALVHQNSWLWTSLLPAEPLESLRMTQTTSGAAFLWFSGHFPSLELPHLCFPSHDKRGIHCSGWEMSLAGRGNLVQLSSRWFGAWIPWIKAMGLLSNCGRVTETRFAGETRFPCTPWRSCSPAVGVKLEIWDLWDSGGEGDSSPGWLVQTGP